MAVFERNSLAAYRDPRNTSERKKAGLELDHYLAHEDGSPFTPYEIERIQEAYNRIPESDRKWVKNGKKTETDIVFEVDEEGYVYLKGKSAYKQLVERSPELGELLNKPKGTAIAEEMGEKLGVKIEHKREWGFDVYEYSPAAGLSYEQAAYLSGALSDRAENIYPSSISSLGNDRYAVRIEPEKLERATALKAEEFKIAAQTMERGIPLDDIRHHRDKAEFLGTDISTVTHGNPRHGYTTEVKVPEGKRALFETYAEHNPVLNGKLNFSKPDKITVYGNAQPVIGEIEAIVAHNKNKAAELGRAPEQKTATPEQKPAQPPKPAPASEEPKQSSPAPTRLSYEQQLEGRKENIRKDIAEMTGYLEEFQKRDKLPIHLRGTAATVEQLRTFNETGDRDYVKELYATPEGELAKTKFELAFTKLTPEKQLEVMALKPSPVTTVMGAEFAEQAVAAANAEIAKQNQLAKQQADLEKENAALKVTNAKLQQELLNAKQPKEPQPEKLDERRLNEAAGILTALASSSNGDKVLDADEVGRTERMNLFSKLNVNHSGGIEQNELQAAIDRAGLQQSVGDLAKVLGAVNIKVHMDATQKAPVAGPIASAGKDETPQR